MASFNLVGPPAFPEGTSVSAYPISNWNGAQITGAPVGSATETETVTSGVAAFGSLAADTRYVAYAEVSSQHRYVRFSTLTDPSEGDGGGSGVPVGGDTGDVLVKQSAADGDADWTAPAVASDDTPEAASGAGNPGVSDDFSRADHVHPAAGGGGAGLIDAYTVPGFTGMTTGAEVATGIAGTNQSFFSNGRGTGIPVRVTKAGTYQIGINIGVVATSGGVVRVMVYAHSASTGKPAALVADLGTLDATVLGKAYPTGTVVLAADTIYWVICTLQGSPATPAQAKANSVPYVHLPYLESSNTGAARALRYTITGAAPDPAGAETARDTDGALTLFFKLQ